MDEVLFSVIILEQSGNEIEQTLKSVTEQKYDHVDVHIKKLKANSATAEEDKKSNVNQIDFADEKLKVTGQYIFVLNEGARFPSSDFLAELSESILTSSNLPDLILGNVKSEKNNGAFFDIYTKAYNRKDLWKNVQFIIDSCCIHKELFLTAEELDKQYYSYDFLTYISFRKENIEVLYLDKIFVISKDYKSLSDIDFSNKARIVKKNSAGRQKTTSHFFTQKAAVSLKKSPLIGLYDILEAFLYNYLPNHIISQIPFYSIRHFYYRKVMRYTIDNRASIHLNCFVLGRKISIGKNSVINRRCVLDARGGIVIGNNVSVSPFVHIITADHDMNSPWFPFKSEEVVVEDYVWIGSRATILPGVTLGKGCVVCAGALVSKNVEPYSVVGGVPAKKIKARAENLQYDTSWKAWFD